MYLFVGSTNRWAKLEPSRQTFAASCHCIRDRETDNPMQTPNDYPSLRQIVGFQVHLGTCKSSRQNSPPPLQNRVRTPQNPSWRTSSQGSKRLGLRAQTFGGTSKPLSTVIHPHPLLRIFKEKKNPGLRIKACTPPTAIEWWRTQGSGLRQRKWRTWCWTLRPERWQGCVRVCNCATQIVRGTAVTTVKLPRNTSGPKPKNFLFESISLANICTLQAVRHEISRPKTFVNSFLTMF